MTGDGWKWQEIANKKNSLKWLEMAGMARYDWKWPETVENDWK